MMQQARTVSREFHTVLCARQTGQGRGSRATPARKATGSPGARAARAPRPAAPVATGASAPPARGAGTWQATAVWHAPLRAPLVRRQPAVWPVPTGTSRRRPSEAPGTVCPATRRRPRGFGWQASTGAGSARRRQGQAPSSASVVRTETSPWRTTAEARRSSAASAQARSQGSPLA